MITWASLADGQLPSTTGALYTVPSATTVAITYFSVFNTDSIPHTVVIFIKRAGGTARQIMSVSLVAGTFVNVCDDAQGIRLSAGDVISGGDGAGSKCDYLITGAVIA